MGFTRRTPHSRTITTTTTTTTATAVAATTIAAAAAITTADTVAVLPQDRPTGTEPDAL